MLWFLTAFSFAKDFFLIKNYNKSCLGNRSIDDVFMYHSEVGREGGRTKKTILQIDDLLRLASTGMMLICESISLSARKATIKFCPFWIVLADDNSETDVTAYDISLYTPNLRSFHWNRTYTVNFVKLCLLIVCIIGT